MNNLLQSQGVHMMERTYQNALALLETRRRAHSKRWREEQSRRTEEQLNLGNVSTVKGRPGLDRMGDWVEQLGYSDINLDIVHVAGTKGKGSTCLYTSPPLISTRERIQINAKPISKQLFATYTFEIWDKLWYHASQTTDGLELMPRYRQFLMLLSLHVFAKEKVDVAVYETHSGSEYDCTNIIKPTVTGITTIGMDHIRALGPSIENIAWHKAGIFKPGAPAFSMAQDPEVAAVLKHRAAEKGVLLNFIDLDDRLPSDAPVLKFEVQKMNASLAISLTETLLKKKQPEPIYRLADADLRRGLDRFSWPGRFHYIDNGKSKWYLDTAHNELSLKVATQWFAQSAANLQQSNIESLAHPTRVLVFGHRSDRNKTALIRSIVETLKDSGICIQHVIFTTFEERRDGTTSIDFYNTNQETLSMDDLGEFAKIWKELGSTAHISLTSTVEEALQVAETFADPEYGLQAFVTGHDRLVGPALSILEPMYQDHV